MEYCIAENKLICQALPFNLYDGGRAVKINHVAFPRIET